MGRAGTIALAALMGVAGCTTSFKYNDDDTSTDTGGGDTSTDTDTPDVPTDTVVPDTSVDSEEDTFDPHADRDEDGFAPVDGDCDDEDPLVNPAAWDFRANGVDEDCDGVPDNALRDCDCPVDAVLPSGLDMCEPRFVEEVEVISYATDAGQGRGLLRGWGIPENALNVREGCSFVVLSTGVLEPVDGGGTCDHRQPGTSLWDASDPTAICPGTEEDPSPTGGGGTVICDVQQLSVTLRAPSNVFGFGFDFIFITSEYPEWVGTDFNDTFYAILERYSPSERINIVVDEAGNEINASCSFIEDPPDTSLEGTGYDDIVTTSGAEAPCGSSTGWMHTVWPIGPGDLFNLTFSIHDEGDGIFDSAVIIDGFHWYAEPVEGGTFRI